MAALRFFGFAILVAAQSVATSSIIRSQKKIITATGVIDQSTAKPRHRTNKNLRLTCDTLAACTSAYRFGNHARRESYDAKADLEAAGYQFVKAFKKNGSEDGTDDVDFVGLWSSEERCIMNFQGTDSKRGEGDWLNNMNSAPVDAWGIPGVHAGIKKELEGLVNLMDFALIRKTCKKKGKQLIITGHSLGGGLAQLFTLALNKEGDPLNARIKANSLFTFGAMSVGATKLAASRRKTNDCIEGFQFYNARRSGNGSTEIDVARNSIVGGHVLFPIISNKILLFGPADADSEVYECGVNICKDVKDFPLLINGQQNPQGILDWGVNHATATYGLNLGCYDFNRFLKYYRANFQR